MWHSMEQKRGHCDEVKRNDWKHFTCGTGEEIESEEKKKLTKSLAKKKLPTEGCTGRYGERDKRSGHRKMSDDRHVDYTAVFINETLDEDFPKSTFVVKFNFVKSLIHRQYFRDFNFDLCLLECPTEYVAVVIILVVVVIVVVVVVVVVGDGGGCEGGDSGGGSSDDASRINVRVNNATGTKVKQNGGTTSRYDEEMLLNVLHAALSFSNGLQLCIPSRRPQHYVVDHQLGRGGFTIEMGRARTGESRNAYRVLVGRPEGKRPLGRPRRRWEDNIKMDLREVGYDDRDWINLAQDRDRWRAYVRAAGSLKAICVTLRYVAQTCSLKERVRDLLRKCQRKMEKKMLNIILRHRLRDGDIRRQTHLKDAAGTADKLKKKWARHVMRLNANRWTHMLTTWDPRIGKRNAGRQKTRRADELRSRFGHLWSRTAKDRQQWKLITK
ncbi:hypothetical protein ANN_03411 [Periplaneta americana]|uniref:Uncharacterized protein n=1 Tax=Periplaneta americana TaxID=6978 RepID=A0ABQ8TZ18_PERAM|nr:hypothetical protein ANN_03411 [Periplaneta americana]